MFFEFLIELINTSKGFPVIKIPLVISVTSLYLSVMPRRPRWYQNMLYSHFLQCFLKWAFICFSDVLVGKLCSVICLYCSYLKRKYFYKHFQKLYRVLGRMLFKAVYKAYSGTFIYCCPLVQMPVSRNTEPLKQLNGTSFTSICTVSPGINISGYLLSCFLGGFFVLLSSTKPILLAA